MITVQSIRCPAHFLRLVDDRRCGLHVRSDGLPLWTASCLLEPTVDDPTIAEVVGLVPSQDGAHYGWHVRSDGLPPFTATCVLVPTLDDPAIAEVCGLTLAQDGASFGWHVRAMRELLNVGRACGYRRLVANTDGRLWPGWVLIVGCWSWRRRMSSSHLQNRHPPRRIRARLMPSTRPGAAGVRAVSVMAAA